VDALAAAAGGAPLDAPIGGFMTRSPVALEEDATLADAALAMARHGIRHVVVTRDGRLAGVVSERDLFALQRVGIARIAERVRGAQSVAALAEAAGEVRGLAERLLAQGVGAERLTAMVSALNDGLSARVIALLAPKHSLPGAWCWLALGSEGRMEQTQVSDQDNALIVDGDKAAFLPFADEVNRALDAIGFPLCKGDVMARNPRWCLTLGEWQARFAAWIDEPQAEALLNAAIFFDFRPLAGAAHLAGELRDAVLPRARANRTFCRALAEGALQARPPLGLLHDFAAEELDLKGLGARVFVDSARVLALAAGSPATGTAARLRGAGEAAAVEAFHFMQTLRLRARANRVRVAALSDIERRVLKEAFRQAARLQDRLRLDFAL
jgi:CBS domain-containing protein